MERFRDHAAVPCETSAGDGPLDILEQRIVPQRRTAVALTGGSGAGKVQMQDFHFVMRANKASTKLMLACASGEHIPDGLLTCRKAG
jgi:type VI protein secretion system component Hcp